MSSDFRSDPDPESDLVPISRKGSADPDPDQNEMDQQHWNKGPHGSTTSFHFKWLFTKK